MVCTWWSCLGILMNVTSFSHVGFRHVGFRHAAGRLSSEDGSRFATLKIDVWACDAFRACRAREATCRSWTWAVNIFALHTTAPHTANYKNLIWARPGNKASVWVSRAVSACSARAASTAVHVESNSERSQRLSSILSNGHTHKHVVRAHLCIRHAKHDADTYS